MCMEWVKMILEFIQGIGWELFFGFFLYLFRAPIIKLIPKLKGGKLPGGMEFELTDQEDVTQELIEKIKEVREKAISDSRDGPQRIVRCKILSIENEAEQPRIFFSTEGDKSFGTFFDDNGVQRLTLGITKNEPFFVIRNEEGKRLMDLHEYNQQPQINLYDKNENIGVMIKNRKNNSAISFYDEKGNHQASFGNFGEDLPNMIFE